MEVKRFFKVQEELITLRALCLVVDFDSWGLGSQKFLSYEQFKEFVKEEFNDDKTVLQTAFITRVLNGCVLRYLCLGNWNELPIEIETVN